MRFLSLRGRWVRERELGPPEWGGERERVCRMDGLDVEQTHRDGQSKRQEKEQLRGVDSPSPIGPKTATGTTTHNGASGSTHPSSRPRILAVPPYTGSIASGPGAGRGGKASEPVVPVHSQKPISTTQYCVRSSHSCSVHVQYCICHGKELTQLPLLQYP